MGVFTGVQPTPGDMILAAIIVALLILIGNVLLEWHEPGGLLAFPEDEIVEREEEELDLTYPNRARVTP